MENPQENAIGVDFILTVKENDVAVDVSGATTKEMIFTKPDGSSLTKTAAFDSSGTDGKLKYTSIAGDLTPVGEWIVQVNLVLASGFNGRTAPVRFVVQKNFG